MTETSVLPASEELEPVEIDCHIAECIPDQVGRLEVVTERYEKEGYLDGITSVDLDGVEMSTLLSHEGFNILRSKLSPEENENFLKDGLLVNINSKKIYLDKYNWNSIPFVAKCGEEYVGSSRLIIKNGFGLPTTNDPRIEISGLWRGRADECSVEFSQFAIKKGTSADASVKMLKAAYEYSHAMGIKSWVATTDNFVVRFLNSNYFKFDLPFIGPSVDYLGSASTPVYIDLEKALDNASKYESSKRIATFIRGE